MYRISICTAMTARFLRNSMLTEVGTDYVRTAYSKGCTKRRVMYAHVLRNAMMPVVTFLGMIVAEIVAGFRIKGQNPCQIPKIHLQTYHRNLLLHA